MIGRRMARLFAAVVLLASGTYFFVYLWRWEWNRAVIAGILFIAAEVGLGTSSILGRLAARPATTGAAPGGGTGGGPGGPAPDVVARLRETAPPPRTSFAWLSPKPEQMGVFVPVLMGMGVVASALAWVVERLARRTASPALERRLAARLAVLSWPRAGLTSTAADASSILARPVRR
ncbi:MAG: hypothetical protein ACLGI2_15585 [Acidimicrobiia bacterium]